MSGLYDDPQSEPRHDFYVYATRIDNGDVYERHAGLTDREAIALLHALEDREDLDNVTVDYNEPDWWTTGAVGTYQQVVSDLDLDEPDDA